MNINCQNSAYVGRTNLSRDEQTHKILQGEINTLTSNLDITTNNLSILQTNYDITSNDIYEYLNPLTYLINTELTPATILPPVPDIINTYVYNSNVLGEIRFWVKDTQSFPIVNPLDVPDYRVKIDVDGKLKLYYTYDPIINLTWGNGWIDPGNMIIGAVADSANQGITIGVIQGEIVVIQQTIQAQLAALAEVLDQTYLQNTWLRRPDQAENIQELLDVVEQANTLETSMESVDYAYESITGFFSTGNFGFVNNTISSVNSFIANNPATSFMLGAGGVGVSIAYGIIQGQKFNDFIYGTLINSIENNSNLTSNQRRIVGDHAEYDFVSSNIIKNLQKNYYLNQTQGFINSNVLTPQTIQQLYASKIGLGISPSNSVYPLDVVGSINADYYYKTGVRQFMGTSNEYSNLTRLQGFINSNVLSTQTVPQIYTNKIGVGILPSTYQLEVVGNINTDNYYRSGVLQFMGTEIQHSNLSRLQGFINSNVLTPQTIPKIATTEVNLKLTTPTLATKMDINNGTITGTSDISQQFRVVSSATDANTPNNAIAFFGNTALTNGIGIYENGISTYGSSYITPLTIKTKNNTDIIYFKTGTVSVLEIYSYYADFRKQISVQNAVTIQNYVTNEPFIAFITNNSYYGGASFYDYRIIVKNNNIVFTNQNNTTTDKDVFTISSNGNARIYGNLGIGIAPSTFPLDVVGNINADYYYRAGVKQFVGTEVQNCNLSLSQGFTNSNVLSTQTIPKIYANSMGIGIVPSTFPLDVVGNINADYYYRSGVLQFMGTEIQHSNLSRLQGFINSNVLSTQTVPQIYTNKIGIGITPSTFPLDVVGNINADYYYRSGVKQFIGTEVQNCNLSLSQGFTNSNVLSTQTVPQIYTNKIGIGIVPSTFPLDVVGNINADYYYRSGVKQFIGTEVQNCNLSLSQGFINSNVLSIQTVPKIYTNSIGIGTTNAVNLLQIRGGTYNGALMSIDSTTPPRGIGQILLNIGYNSYTLASAGDYYGIGFGNNSFASTAICSCCEIGCLIQNSTGSEFGDLVFSTRPGTSALQVPSERMRINSAGNIGIGTTTINATLDISGSTAYDGTTSLRLCNNASQYGRTQLFMIGRYENTNDGWTLNGGRNQIVFGYQTSLNSAITYTNSIQSFAGSLGFFANGYSTTTPAYYIQNNGGSVFNGSIVVNGNGIYVKNGGNGYITIQPGSSGNYCGYVELYNSSGQRRGYMGYSDVNQQYLHLACENGCLGYWITNGNLSVDGTLQATFSSIANTGLDYLGVQYNYPNTGISSKQVIYAVFGTFTGFHRCFTNDDLFSDESDETINDFKFKYAGRVVVSTGKIATDLTNDDNEWTIHYDKEGITLEDALPIVQLSRQRKDKKVFGVFGLPKRKNSRKERMIVNSVGEGGIWVVNTNGNIENGDYLQTSDELGYAEKQDDDVLHNYTIAKATIDCNFELNSDKYETITLANGVKASFIACTYHCG